MIWGLWATWGESDVITPNLDKLAAGLIFENAVYSHGGLVLGVQVS
jgi:hypothetical protein